MYMGKYRKSWKECVDDMKVLGMKVLGYILIGRFSWMCGATS